ncbi:MAG: hypothetical protein AABW84_00855 [Nanoarchaeota archaeon]
MKNQEYKRPRDEKIYHHRGMPANSSRIIREEILKYDGADILIVQKSNQFIAKSYIVVLGQVLDQIFAKNGKAKTTFVAPIDKEEYTQLEELVKKAGFEGDVQFW